jgi:hypothetical protein
VDSGHATPVGDGWERDESLVAWIYGSVLTGAAVVAATSKVASTAGQVLLYTAVTMIVVWIAHGYAAFVGHGGRMDVDGTTDRFAHAFGSELSILGSAVPTLIALAAAWLLGADVDAAGYAGLVTTIGTMVAAATYAARSAGAGFRGALLAAIGALVIGLALIAAKVALK